MMTGLSLVPGLHGLLALLLLLAAGRDVMSRIIPNGLTLAIAALALPFWTAAGLAPWPDMAVQIAIGLVAILVFAIAFALGVMGGGDVKLIGALGLWFGLLDMMQFLLRMSLLGGVLTMILWTHSRWRRASDVIEVPYGVAISLAALSLLYQRYFNI
jgi:prepilin peptidase CpaA